MHLPQSRLLNAAVLAVALLPTTVLPVAAVVRFEPTPPPTPIPQLPGGRIEVPWAGIAVTFPEDWRVKLAAAPEPSLGAGASILTAFGPDATCSIDVYDPAQVDSWQDVGVEPDAQLTLAGVLVERFDRPWSEGLDGGSAYTVHAPWSTTPCSASPSSRPTTSGCRSSSPSSSSSPRSWQPTPRVPTRSPRGRRPPDPNRDAGTPEGPNAWRSTSTVGTMVTGARRG